MTNIINGNVDLASTVLEYMRINNFAGTNIESARVKLEKMIGKTPLEQIKQQFNAMCDQKIWDDSLVDIFYDSLLQKTLDITTFVIYATWTGDLSTWTKSSPSISIHLGEDEQYPIPKTGDNIFQLTNGDVSSLADHIVRSVLFLPPPYFATISIKDNELVLIDIAGIKTYKKEIDSKLFVVVTLDVIVDSDLELLVQMIDRLRTRNFVSVTDIE